jgi:hypothetical protein
MVLQRSPPPVVTFSLSGVTRKPFHGWTVSGVDVPRTGSRIVSRFELHFAFSPRKMKKLVETAN